MSQDPSLSHLERSTRLICDLLTETELAALFLAVQFESDPCMVQGYQKAQSLFNQAGGTRMSPAVQEIFEAVVQERLHVTN